MNRLDRALGILLLLRSGRSLSAVELSRHFEVSTRTIYRDVEALCALGVPIYAEMGRNGGFKLVEGYFLPPVMFSEGEAISLLLGLALLGSLRARPFAAELASGQQKLLAAVPEHLRVTLEKMQRIIGFERMAADIFHPERADSAQPLDNMHESVTVSVFLRAIFEQRGVAIDYHSPYGSSDHDLSVMPLGLLWDRDRWYLVGEQPGHAGTPRLWRADRVLAIVPEAPTPGGTAFDIGALLGHIWLEAAIRHWSELSPVVLRITGGQAERLKQDWYYRHARFEELASGWVKMTFGEDNRGVVLDLLRWLGPGAELIAPVEWRAALRAELAEMLAAHADERIEDRG
jgi:predicted DNA-binding transcriptional regulator YafY